MPKWLSDESFTVEATIAPETMDALSRLTPDARRAARQHMLQALLADRFHLVVRQEKKELPMFMSLTVAPNGPKLHDRRRPVQPVRKRSPISQRNGFGTSRRGV